MDKKKKKNILIVSLFAVMLLMGVGYALLQQVLTINGTTTLDTDFNVYIESITPTESGLAESVSATVGEDGLSASFEAKLMAPKDKIDYEIVVKNDGKIDAELTAVVNLTSEMPDYVTYTDDFVEGTILESGDSYTFTVTTKFNEDVTSIDLEELTIPLYTLSINCVQYNAPELEPIEDNIVATGDISIEGDGSVIFTYYSDGALVISGNGDILSFETAKEINASIFPLLDQIAARVLMGENNDIFNYEFSDLFDEDVWKGEYSYAKSCIWNDDVFTSLGTTREEYFDTYGNEDVINACEIIPVLTSVTIEEGITLIPDSLFEDFRGIGDIVIPSTVTSIGNSSFYNAGLTSVTFTGANDGTSSLLMIKSDTFKNNSIETLYLPQSLTSINENAFRNNNLTQVTIQGNYTTFASSVFSNNPSLTKGGITLLNSPTKNGVAFNIDNDISWSAVQDN